jgi:hypothetical protein
MELSFSDRLTIGASMMIEDVQTDMTERTDNLCSPVALMGSGCGAVGDSGNNTGTSSVKAEFSNLMTGYVELNIWNGLYAKYGYMEMDLET